MGGDLAFSEGETGIPILAGNQREKLIRNVSVDVRVVDTDIDWLQTPFLRTLFPRLQRETQSHFQISGDETPLKTSNYQKSTEHANREIWPTNSLTKVLTKMPTRVYTKMSTEMPTKAEAFFCVKRTRGSPRRLPRECSREIFQCSQEIFQCTRKCTRKWARSIFTCPIFTCFVSWPNYPWGQEIICLTLISGELPLGPKLLHYITLFFRINFPDYVIFVYITELVSNYFLGYVISCVVLEYTMWTLDYIT